MSFLFVDQILELVEGKYVCGHKLVSEDDFYLYPSRIFPSALIGETLGQLAAWNVMKTLDFQKRPVAGIVESASVEKPVQAGDCLYLEAFIEQLDETVVAYRGQATVNNEVVFSLVGALGPLLPMETFIDHTTIREQFHAIYPHQRISSSSHPSRPVEQPWFYFDTIVSHQPGQMIVAEKTISPNFPFFKDHFPLKPVLPLTVLLENILNLAPPLLQKQGSIQLKKIKMKEFVSPGDTLRTTLKVKEKTDNELILQCHTEQAGKRVCTLELVEGCFS